LIPPGEIPACVQTGVPACCGGNCGAGVISTQQEIDTCIADINAASCMSIDVLNGERCHRAARAWSGPR